MNLAEVRVRTDSPKGGRERLTCGQESRTGWVIDKSVIDGSGLPAGNGVRITAGDPCDHRPDRNREPGSTSGYGEFVVPSLDRERRSRDRSNSDRSDDHEADDEAECRDPTPGGSPGRDGLQCIHQP